MSALWKDPKDKQTIPFAKSFIVIWVFCIVLSIGGSAAVIWALIHFTKKFW